MLPLVHTQIRSYFLTSYSEKTTSLAMILAGGMSQWVDLFWREERTKQEKEKK